MGIKVYLNAKEYGLDFKNAHRIEWIERPVQVLRYGKNAATSESWCVLQQPIFERGGT